MMLCLALAYGMYLAVVTPQNHWLIVGGPYLEPGACHRAQTVLSHQMLSAALFLGREHPFGVSVAK